MSLNQKKTKKTIHLITTNISSINKTEIPPRYNITGSDTWIYHRLTILKWIKLKMSRLIIQPIVFQFFWVQLINLEVHSSVESKFIKKKVCDLSLWGNIVVVRPFLCDNLIDLKKDK